MASSSTTEPIPRIVEFFNELNNEMPNSTKVGLLEIERLDREVRKLGEVYYQRKVDYMSNYQKLSGEQRVKAFNDLQAEMTRISELADKKVEIARGLRGSVDQIYKRFREEEQLFIENIPTDLEVSDEKNDEKTVKLKSESEGDDDEPVDRRKKKKGGKKKSDTTEDNKSYCWCQLEKQDQMIFCDNKTCKYEWFHFSCLGINVAPPGEWYCSELCEQEARENPKEESPEPEQQKPGPGRKSLKRKK